MIHKDISLSDIKSFVVLVESGSFTLAAEKLLCSRSHISKQLAHLETTMGVSLLVRTTRSQQLTPQGEEFFNCCKRSLAAIEAGIDQAMEGSEELRGSVRVNSVGGKIGEEIVGALVQDFMSQYPDVLVDLQFNSQRVDPVNGEIDFVFRMGELNDSNLIARKLCDIPINAFASPEYLAQCGELQHPRELAEQRCIVGSVHNWVFTDGEQNTEVLLQGQLECKNGKVMLQSALAGKGIIRVPELYCRDELQQELLQPVFKHWRVQPTSLHLVYPKDKFQPARLRAFKDFVCEHFADYL